MYAPERDQRITPGDSELEYTTKGQLMEVFQELAGADNRAARGLEEEIERLERVLQDEIARKVREYEQRIGKA